LKNNAIGNVLFSVIHFKLLLGQFNWAYVGDHKMYEGFIGRMVSFQRKDLTAW